MCIDPLDPAGHPSDIVNINDGKLAHPTVNVENALELGQTKLVNFRNSLPEGFYLPLKNNAITMGSSRKGISLNNHTSLDTTAMFSRALGLLVTHDMEPEEMFKYELAPSAYPTSMFKENGKEVRTKLHIKHSSRNLPSPDAVHIDG